MKKLWIILLDVLIVLIVLCNYRVVQKVVDPSLGTVSEENENTEIVDINITYEKDLGNNAIVEVKKAVQKFPAEVIKGFVDKGWKIAVVSEIDLTGTEFEGTTTPLTVGLTDYDKKTIQVSPCESNLSGYIYIRTLHEMSHFADSYYGDVSDSEEWMALYNQYKDSYMEFEFNGIPKTAENASDLEYATSNRWEFFSCAMKDYLNQPEYVKQNYPGVYEYFSRLTIS